MPGDFEITSTSSVGKRIRFQRIFPSNDSRSVIFAMDHGLELGPSVFTADSLDPRKILSKVTELVLTLS